MTARHLGGTNVGWADGHATWVAAQGLVAMSNDSEIEYVGSICHPYTSYEGYAENCGDPDQGQAFLFSRKTDWWGK